MPNQRNFIKTEMQRQSKTEIEKFLLVIIGTVGYTRSSGYWYVGTLAPPPPLPAPFRTEVPLPNTVTVQYIGNFSSSTGTVLYRT